MENSPSFYTNKAYIYDFGYFLEHPVRFISYVKYKNRRIKCHLPDPGKLSSVFYPNAEVLLRFSTDQQLRATAASMIGIKTRNNVWVSTDSQLANRFIKSQWYTLPILNHFDSMQPEFSFGKSRIDFCFKKIDQPSWLVEVKTVAVIYKDGTGIAEFPDVPTKRGIKHLLELSHALASGYKSLVIFFVPRSDATEVRPNTTVDPNFADTLQNVVHSGVQLLAIRCSFSPKGVIYDTTIPVRL